MSPTEGGLKEQEICVIKISLDPFVIPFAKYLKTRGTTIEIVRVFKKISKNTIFYMHP